MEEFYNLLLATSITTTPARWVFEDRMHQLLRTERTLELFPILPHLGKTNVMFDNYTASKTKKNPTEFRLTRPKEHRLVEGAKLQMNHYCRPESSTFAAVASVLLINPPNEPPILLMFQITRNKTKHITKPGGLWKIDGLIVPPGTRKYLVIVTPEDVHPGITVPLEYFGGTVQIQSEATDGVEGEEGQDVDMDIWTKTRRWMWINTKKQMTTEMKKGMTTEAIPRAEDSGHYSGYSTAPSIWVDCSIHDHIRSCLR